MFELCCKSRPFSSVTTNGSVLHKHSHVKPSTRGGFSVRVFHQTTYKREKENIIHCRRSRRMQRFEPTTGHKTNLCIWNSFACLCVLPSPFSPEPLSSQILCLRLRTGLEITHLFARTLESEGRWIAGCQVTSQLNMWRRCKWESSHFGVNNSLITLKFIYRAVRNETVNRLQLFHPRSWRLFCISAQKNCLPHWSYQPSFSKRPVRRLWETKDCTYTVYRTVLQLAKLQPFVTISTYLLLNISHKIACVHLCRQLVLVPPTRECVLAWKQNVQFNGQKSHTSPLSKLNPHP